MYRTPAKTATISREASPMMDNNRTFEITPCQSNDVILRPTPSVRKSIEEREAATQDSNPKKKILVQKTTPVEPQKPKPWNLVSQESKLLAKKDLVDTAKSPPVKTKYVDRISEASACVEKAKNLLDSYRGMKGDVKKETFILLDRLLYLVKESESVKTSTRKIVVQENKLSSEAKEVENNKNNALIKKLEEHTELLKQNTQSIELLKEVIKKQSYASVVAASSKDLRPERTALHSIVVTGKDETETGEEVLNKIRKAVNAKDGEIRVEQVRKAKDRKVIVGCRTEEERRKVHERIKNSGEHLNVEDIKNKDPLVILRDVLQYNSDEEILSALKCQNKDIFKDLNKNDIRTEIAFKKRTRNPLTSHVILRVSPKIWKRMIEREAVHIDLQRIRVADQSPLVQCSLCLGYGHGRKFCKETQEKCSHCGGPHMRNECADWLARVVPRCCNCTHAKLAQTDHNAFSQECAVRRKWETLARATVAYC